MGLVHLYTGSGGGKTTAALGVALRALGHGYKVIMVQFLKGRKNIGEYKIQKKLKNFKVYQFGSKEFINLRKPSKKDKELAKKGLEFVKEVIKEKPRILILDEINLAIKIKLISLEDLLKVLEKVHRNTEVYLTGRYASKGLIEKADFVSKIEDKKRVDVTRRGVDW